MKRNEFSFAALAALVVTLLANVAIAGGDSGTGSMGEMQVGGGMLLLLVGGMVVMGGVIYLLAKFMK